MLIKVIIKIKTNHQSFNYTKVNLKELHHSIIKSVSSKNLINKTNHKKSVQVKQIEK